MYEFTPNARPFRLIETKNETPDAKVIELPVDYEEAYDATPGIAQRAVEAGSPIAWRTCKVSAVFVLVKPGRGVKRSTKALVRWLRGADIPQGELAIRGKSATVQWSEDHEVFRAEKARRWRVLLVKVLPTITAGQVGVMLTGLLLGHEAAMVGGEFGAAYLIALAIGAKRETPFRPVKRELVRQASPVRRRVETPAPDGDEVTGAVPELVTWADVLPAIEAAGDEEIVLGLTAGGRVSSMSLAGDSAMIGVSIPSGQGKSTFTRAVIAQMLHRGAVAVILDVKVKNHQVFMSPDGHEMPNAAVFNDVADVHNALIALEEELMRRQDVAKTDVFDEEDMGPRVLIVGEELNATMPMLKSYWKNELDGKGESPAITAFKNLSCLGRASDMNIIGIAQKFNSDAGGGDTTARTNMAVFVIGAASDGVTWNMVGDCKRPEPSNRRGHVYVSGTGSPVETQLVYTDDDERRKKYQSLDGEARSWALSGTVSNVSDVLPALFNTQSKAEPERNVLNDLLTLAVDLGKSSMPWDVALSQLQREITWYDRFKDDLDGFKRFVRDAGYQANGRTKVTYEGRSGQPGFYVDLLKAALNG